MSAKLIITCDGACTVNPGGIATWAWVMVDDTGQKLLSQYGCLGEGLGMTNNRVEYQAVLEALRFLKAHKITALIKTDSQLVVNHIDNPSTCKAEHLKPLQVECTQLLVRTGATLEWIKRERNVMADALTRKAIKFYQARPEEHVKSFKIQVIYHNPIWLQQGGQHV